MKKTSLLKAMFISLLLSSLPSSSFAYDFSADNDDGVTIYYNITSSTDRTVEVTGLGNYEYSGDVVIPSTVKYDNTTYLVTSIGESAFSVSSLTSVEIPSSVTSIGSDAFYYCESLTSIEIPSSVTSIGGGAFFYCSSLTSIEIPSSVTSIGSSAFFYCSSLTSIEIPSGVTSIGSYAFGYCSSLTSVTFGDNSQLTSIGDHAFDSCSSLASIEIPSGVTSIGSYAFYNCSSLTSIEIPSGVTSIGNDAFKDSGLVTVNYNAVNCTSAGSSNSPVFEFCTAIANVTIGEAVETIPAYLFYWSWASFTSIEIPNSVTSIGSYAFYNCSSLASVTFGDNSQLTSIGSYAFGYCESLASVTFGDNSQLTSIGSYAFYYCSSLASITFGDNSQLTSIGSYAFSGCSSFASIEIPSGVTSIGEHAFDSCSSLASITFGDNSQLTSVSSYAFANTGLTYVVIPNAVTTISADAFDSCESLETVVIGSSVTKIGNYAFWYCTALSCLISCNPEPPVCGTNVFGNVDKNSCTLYVPAGTESDYATADQWKDFINVEEISVIVKTYQATGVTANSATLTGIVIAGEDEITSQGFEYWSDEDDVRTVSVDVTDMSVTITDLTHNTMYYYRAFATTASDTYYGETLTFTTKLVAPTVITNDATNISNHSATLSGSIIQGDEEIKSKGFKLYSPVGERTVTIDEGADMSVTVTTLTKDTTYKFYAFATTASDTYYGETLSFTTLVDGISNITTEATEVSGYYTIDGKELNAPVKGVNIIRYKDGTTKKVLMK